MALLNAESKLVMQNLPPLLFFPCLFFCIRLLKSVMKMSSYNWPKFSPEGNCCFVYADPFSSCWITSQALVFFSPQHPGSREARRKTAQREIMLSSLLMLVHLVSLSSSSLHRLLKSAEALQSAGGRRPFPCAGAERFVIGSSSPEEWCKSNGGKKH